MDYKGKLITLGERLFPQLLPGLDVWMDYGFVEFAGRWARNILLIGALAVGIGNNIEYSQGTMAGTVNKISEKGLVWKTYEGQIALDGIISKTHRAGLALITHSFEENVLDFSIDKQAKHGENPKELVEKIRYYSGTKVKMNYVKQFSTWPWRSRTNYLIQSVEPVEKK